MILSEGKRKFSIKRQIFICLLIFFSLNSSFAQQLSDSTSTKRHSPQKATIMSAILPGLGQIYNKKYWKVPIVYAGVATVGYFAVTNNQNYNKYKTAYQYRTDGNTATVDDYVGKYSDQNLLEIKDYYRRNLELTVIAGVAVYALNIIDAAVDAHLYDFEVNDNLSLNIKPVIFQNNTSSFASGLSLSINLKSFK